MSSQNPKAETSRGAAGGEAQVSVLVVDDQDRFRGVLCELVAATPGFTVAGEAACGEDALPAADALSPALVLMDVRMPGCGGIEAARLLTERHPELVVVLVSVQEPPELRPSDLAGGMVTFVSKRDLRATLLRELWQKRAHLAEQHACEARGVLRTSGERP